jgi:hypothetical protein
MPSNPISGPYSAPAASYSSAISNSKYSRVVHVSGSLNNPFTATGSNANPAGIIVLAQGSVFLQFKGSSVTYPSGQFYEVGASHVIYDLPITYISASNTGSVLVLY